MIPFLACLLLPPFTVDPLCREEITSWVVPIEIDPVPMTAADEARYEAAALLDRRKTPRTCTSHTFFMTLTGWALGCSAGHVGGVVGMEVVQWR